MIFGIGIDIIEIDRVKDSVEKYGDHFLNKIYTPAELEYCLNKTNKYQHLAARFAAKEAVYKALSTGLNSDVGWHDIEIYNAPNGMPLVKIYGKLEKILDGEKNLKISMSHSRDYVTCVAIVFKENK
ncbi:MAG: holo-ACP synthase [Ignavibacteriaceae bacterium]